LASGPGPQLADYRDGRAGFGSAAPRRGPPDGPQAALCRNFLLRRSRKR